MKFLLRTRIPDVISFEIFNNSLFTIQSNSRLFKDDSYICDCFALSNARFAILGYPTNNTQTYIIGDKAIERTINYQISSRGIIGHSGLVFSSTERKNNKTVGVYSFEHDTVKWLNNFYDIGYYERINDVLTFIDLEKYSLSSMNLETGEIEWNTSNIVEDLINDILVLNDKILVRNKEYQYWLIGINKGDIKQYITPFNSKNINKKFYLNSPILNQDKLIFFERQYLVETNLNTGHTEWKWHEPNHNIAASVVIDNYIYFLDSSEFFPNAFGIFDRAKNEIIHWQHVDLPKFGMLTQKPVVCEDKIYLRDDQKNLYIYQRVE